jgi:pimeloyl-ACP methyl ester carboxylesterase
VFFHGTPGSRLLCPDLNATERAGVRFISFDRPGYGRSERLSSQLRCADVVADVVEILDRFGIDRAAMVGWSGGGKFALAFGALAPDRVTAVAALCSPSAPADSRDVSLDVLRIFEVVRLDPEGNRESVRARNQWLADDPQLLLRLTEETTPAVLDAPGMREAFVAWTD